MAPCRIFKYYKNMYCSRNLTENPEKFWVEYSNRLVGLGQVASLTKSGQEPGFLHFMWRYRLEVLGSLSQLTLPKMNAEVSVRA
jgi:hypothetical protein